MFKITVFVSLMLIAGISAARPSCYSCGNECVSSCGTRRFRTCCFNYLRKKRVPDTVKILTPNTNGNKFDSSPKQTVPLFIVESAPEQWFSNIMADDFKSYADSDKVGNRLENYED